MKGYDSLLFRALIGANQLEFKENMDSAESAEYSYSPRYNRFRLQILADPFRWAKKRRRPMWQKIITNVACIILVCSIALGGLMVVSPTVRAVVLNWLRDISGNRITYFSNGDNSLTADRASWRPTWLPEGWVVTDIYSRSSRSWWSFKDSNGSGASLTCACFDPSEESMSTIIDTDEIDKAHTTVTIQEYVPAVRCTPPSPCECASGVPAAPYPSAGRCASNPRDRSVWRRRTSPAGCPPW